MQYFKSFLPNGGLLTTADGGIPSHHVGFKGGSTGGQQAYRQGPGG